MTIQRCRIPAPAPARERTPRYIAMPKMWWPQIVLSACMTALHSNPRHHQHQHLISVNRLLHMIVSSRVMLELHHVYAHDGHPWNECVDCVCAYVKDRSILRLRRWPGILDKERVQQMAWAWSASDNNSVQYPLRESMRWYSLPSSLIASPIDMQQPCSREKPQILFLFHEVVLIFYLSLHHPLCDFARGKSRRCGFAFFWFIGALLNQHGAENRHRY